MAFNVRVNASSDCARRSRTSDNNPASAAASSGSRSSAESNACLNQSLKPELEINARISSSLGMVGCPVAWGLTATCFEGFSIARKPEHFAQASAAGFAPVNELAGIDAGSGLLFYH
jgi:hypothetical protein